MVSRSIDITGRVYGRLTVIRMAGLTANGKSQCLCRCACGTEKVIATNNLNRGNTNSCGCLHRQVTSVSSTSHGMSRSAEYRAWDAMRSRCCRPASSSFRNYGGRGITICDRWMEGFENFFQDMGAKPSPSHSLDRIDVDGDYEPGNCRWATGSVQNINRRPAKTATGVRGVYATRSGKWQATLIHEGAHVLLKVFDNLLDAAAARKSAELKCTTLSLPYWAKERL